MAYKDKEKRRAYYRIYNKNHPEMVRVCQKKYRDNNPEKVKALTKRWKKNNREKVRIASRRYHKNVRYKLFQILGGSKCTSCGFTDMRALQIDHKNGGGMRELKSFGGLIPFCAYYINNPNIARVRLQILCANCNWIKKHINNENPRLRQLGSV